MGRRAPSLSRRKIDELLARGYPLDAIELYNPSPASAARELRASMWIISAAALGIVFSMVRKPEWPGALATMAVALVVGWFAAMLRRWRPVAMDAAAATVEEVSAG